MINAANVLFDSWQGLARVVLLGVPAYIALVLTLRISGKRTLTKLNAFDFVITVCDNAKESCPVFPAGTRRIHWSFEDPAAVEGTEAERLEAFRRTRNRIHERVRAFLQEQGGAAGAGPSR